MFSFLNKTKKFVPTLNKVVVFSCIALLLVTISMGVFVEKTNAQFSPALGGALAGAVSSGIASSAIDLANTTLQIWASFIMESLLRITSLLLYVAGIILEYVIEVSVVNLESVVGSEGVRSAWGAFRDIANMSFIFIILYIAISTILGTGVNMRKTLARVVIVALLLNFSFFFTKIAVDASNIVTVGFYNQIANSPCGPSGQPAGDIGRAFMCHMGLATTWSESATNTVIGTASGLNLGNLVIRGIMGSLFFLIAAFVFLAAGLMFLARFIAFIFLFILSPLAFAAMAVPGGDKWTDQWKEALFKNCIFAPAFMLTVWATLKVLGAVNQQLLGGRNEANLITALTGNGAGGPTQDAGQVFLSYAIVIGMIIGSLIVAQKFGAYGAGGAIKMLDKSRKGIQGAVGRQTVGRFGNWADNKVSKSDSWIGRRANSTFGREIRALTTGAAAKAKFGSKTDFTKYAKDKKKSDEDYAKEIEKQHKDKAQFTYDRLKNNVTKAENEFKKKAEVATSPDTQNERRKKELETKLTKDRETLADLNAAQKTDQRLLEENKGTPGYSIIKNRIDDRANEIKKLDTQITSGPEVVELKAIEDASKKAMEAAMAADKGVEAAMNALAEFERFNEEEAKKLFSTSGKEEESQEKGKKMGLSDEDFKEFMEIEREKYVTGVKKLFEDKKTKKDAPVRVQLMRDAGEYGKLRGDLAKTMRKTLREGEPGKRKTQELIKGLAESQGVKVSDEEGGDDGKGGDKEGGGDKKDR